MYGIERAISRNLTAAALVASSFACGLDERDPGLGGAGDSGSGGDGGSAASVPDAGDSGSSGSGGGAPACEGESDCEPPACNIGGVSIAAGTVNPSNPCQICDPEANADAYSVNVDAACGSGAVECSGQDTCNAAGECVPNHLPDTTTCTSQPDGRCDGAGTCVDLLAGRAAASLGSVTAGTLGGYFIQPLEGEPFEIISSGHDVNGDGRSDILAGAPGAADGGAAYLIFGQDRTATLTLDSFINAQGPGFRIGGAPAAQSRNLGIGSDVLLAGNIDGAAGADLVVTWWTENPTIGLQPGASYVIFGKASSIGISTSAIASATAGSGGFAINGVGQQSGFRHFVAAVGDQNGDGLDDLAVPMYVDAAGDPALRVVFGKDTLTPAGTSAADGFDIISEDQGFTLQSLAGVGDVNGDGRSDILIAAQRFRDALGSIAYVVFGQAAPGPVNLSAIEDGEGGGFVLRDVARLAENDLLGTSVAPAGDLNGDELADLIIGSQNALVNGNYGAGRVFVVFGRAGTTPVDLGPIAAGEGGGFVINGAFGNEQTGRSVTAIGDQNGDGVRDILIGASNFGAEVGPGAGAIYLVFGKTSADAVSLADIQQGGRGGFAVFGAAASQQTGASVAAGDINGDGTDDIVTTAGGGVYVVFGGQ